MESWHEQGMKKHDSYCDLAKLKPEFSCINIMEMYSISRHRQNRVHPFTACSSPSKIITLNKFGGAEAWLLWLNY